MTSREKALCRAQEEAPYLGGWYHVCPSLPGWLAPRLSPLSVWLAPRPSLSTWEVGITSVPLYLGGWYHVCPSLPGRVGIMSDPLYLGGWYHVFPLYLGGCYHICLLSTWVVGITSVSSLPGWLVSRLPLSTWVVGITSFPSIWVVVITSFPSLPGWLIPRPPGWLAPVLAPHFLYLSARRLSPEPSSFWRTISATPADSGGGGRSAPRSVLRAWTGWDRWCLQDGSGRHAGAPSGKAKELNGVGKA